MHSAHSTLLMMTSKSTSSSKQAVSMMNSLELKSPTKKTKKIQDEESAIESEDAVTIDWSSKKEVHGTLIYYGKDPLKLKDIEYNDKIVLLCTHFKPTDIRLVFQGISQEAGTNWQNLKVAKLRTMKAISVEFAKACVDIYNAKSDFTVPG